MGLVKNVFSCVRRPAKMLRAATAHTKGGGAVVGKSWARLDGGYRGNQAMAGTKKRNE